MVLFKQLKKSLLLLIVLVFITSLSSCYLTESVTLEVLQFPKSPLPKQTQRIAFVDKTCPENRDSIGFYYLLDHAKMYSEFPSDSILSQSFINGMKSSIDHSGFYEIFDEFIPYSNCSYNSKSKTLTLQQAVDADILVSLENLTLNDVTTFSPNFYDGVIGKMYLHLSSKINIYSLKNNTLIKSFSFSDSMYWYTDAYTAEEAYLQLPKRYDVFPEAYFWFGEEVAQNFCPFWKDVQRTIYTSYIENFLQRGTKAAIINNWQRAAYYWLEAEKSTNKTISAYASYNLAVYEELNNNITNALEQIKKSQSKKETTTNYNYLKILQTEMKKKENFELLK